MHLQDDGTRVWYRGKDHELHRLDGPAVEGPNGSESWYRNGKLHRDGCPALTQPDGTVEYWVGGKRHRTDGPAREFPHADPEFWVDGQKLDTESVECLLFAKFPLADAIVWAQHVPPHLAIRARDAGLPVEFAAGCYKAGFGRASDIVRLHQAGVPAEYVAALESAIVGDDWDDQGLNAEDVIRLHRAGIPERYASIVTGNGFSADDTIRMHDTGVPPEWAVSFKQGA